MVYNFRRIEYFLKLTAKYVGKFYSDNFDENFNYVSKSISRIYIDYNDNKNDSYFVIDFFGSFEMNLFNGLTNSKVFIQVNNIFDNLYSAYAIGKEFFPCC